MDNFRQNQFKQKPARFFPAIGLTAGAGTRSLFLFTPR
jgi:hypothetical protein